jgi:hypothetical protein
MKAMEEEWKRNVEIGGSLMHAFIIARLKFKSKKAKKRRKLPQRVKFKQNNKYIYIMYIGHHI